MPWVVVFRACVAFLAFLYGYQKGIPLVGLIAAMPLALIAVGVGLQRRWALWLVVIYDALLVFGYVGYDRSWNALFGRDVMPSHILGCTIFGIEGVYVLQRLWNPRVALKAFIACACIAFLLGSLVGSMKARRTKALYQPMLAYIDANWLPVPDDLTLSSLEREGSSYTFSFKYKERVGPDPDGFMATKFWTLDAKKRADGSLWFIKSDKASKYNYTLRLPWDSDKRSAKSALGMLKSKGVHDPGLAYRGSGTAGYGMPGGELEKAPYWSFHSPRTNVTYRVINTDSILSGTEVYLGPDRP